MPIVVKYSSLKFPSTNLLMRLDFPTAWPPTKMTLKILCRERPWSSIWSIIKRLYMESCLNINFFVCLTASNLTPSLRSWQRCRSFLEAIKEVINRHIRRKEKRSNRVRNAKKLISLKTTWGGKGTRFEAGYEHASSGHRSANISNSIRVEQNDTTDRIDGKWFNETHQKESTKFCYLRKLQMKFWKNSGKFWKTASYFWRTVQTVILALATDSNKRCKL